MNGSENKYLSMLISNQIKAACFLSCVHVSFGSLYLHAYGLSVDFEKIVRDQEGQFQGKGDTLQVA